ncbi:MAG: hypothetical protein WC734_03550 [Patescibacteria group bacterium]|jgi:hypothetical protein
MNRFQKLMLAVAALPCAITLILLVATPILYQPFYNAGYEAANLERSTAHTYQGAIDMNASHTPPSLATGIDPATCPFCAHDWRERSKLANYGEHPHCAS